METFRAEYRQPLVILAGALREMRDNLMTMITFGSTHMCVIAEKENTHVHIYTNTHTYATHMHAYTRTLKYMHTNTNKHTCAHIYTHLHR